MVRGNATAVRLAAACDAPLYRSPSVMEDTRRDATIKVAANQPDNEESETDTGSTEAGIAFIQDHCRL